MTAKEDIKIGNMPVAAIEKMFGHIGNKAILNTFSVLANSKGKERRQKILQILASLAHISNWHLKEGPNTESNSAEPIILASLHSMDSFSEAVTLLEEIAAMPKGSMATKLSSQYSLEYLRREESVDFTPTLKLIAALTVLSWNGVWQLVGEDYQRYIAVIIKLFTEGRVATEHEYALFTHKRVESPVMADLTKVLSELNWKKNPDGIILLEVLRQLANKDVLSKENKGSFLNAFAREVAHKFLSSCSLKEIFSNPAPIETKSPSAT